MDSNAGALDLSLAINPETFTLEQKQDRWGGGLDVFHAQCDGQGKELKTLRPKPEAVQLRVVVQDTRTGALGSVHIPLSRLRK